TVGAPALCGAATITKYQAPRLSTFLPSVRTLMPSASSSSVTALAAITRPVSPLSRALRCMRRAVRAALGPRGVAGEDQAEKCQFPDHGCAIEFSVPLGGRGGNGGRGRRHCTKIHSQGRGEEHHMSFSRHSRRERQGCAGRECAK